MFSKDLIEANSILASSKREGAGGLGTDGICVGGEVALMMNCDQLHFKEVT